MDNFIPEWLKTNNNLSKSEVSGNNLNQKSDIELNKTVEFTNKNIKGNSIIKENGLKPKKYNLDKNKKQNDKLNLSKYKKKPEIIKERPKISENQDEDYSYTDVNNFVDRFYFAPKIINNPEIYITSSEEEFSDDLEDFNYN